MKKLRKFTSKKSVKRVFSFAMCAMLMLSLGLPAFAAEGDLSTEAVSAITSAFGEVTSTIKIGNVLSVLTIVLTTAVGFFFFWWGIRKVIKIVTAAFKKGKISV